MKALRDVFGDTLVASGLDKSERRRLWTRIWPNSTKADKFAMAYPDRFLQMGIAEQNFVGVAVGLASLGSVPWLSTFTVFFTHRAVDPIRMLVAQTHANVKIGAAYSGLLTGLTGKNAPGCSGHCHHARDARHDRAGSRRRDRRRSHYSLGNGISGARVFALWRAMRRRISLTRSIALCLARRSL